jgi:hypothetical protein
MNATNTNVDAEKIENNPLIGPVQKSFTDKVSILINLFIKPEIKENKSLDKKEFIAAARLIKKYPDFDFFYDLPELTNKFNSLFGLLSKKWINLDVKYKQFLLDKIKNPEYILSDTPLIKIEVEKRKAQSVMEFLNEKD